VFSFSATFEFSVQSCSGTWHGPFCGPTEIKWFSCPVFSPVLYLTAQTQTLRAGKKRLVSTHLASHDNKHEQLLPSPPTFKTQQEKEASEGDAIAEKRRGKRKLQDLHGGRG
jgi:hypothetical protein